MRIAVAIAVALLVVAGIAVAQPPACVDQACVQLPLVLVAGATETVTPTATIAVTPALDSRCMPHAPTPAEGLQIWIPDPRPAPRSYVLICSRLTVNSRPVYGAALQIVIHRSTYDEVMNTSSQTSGAFGVFGGDVNPGDTLVEVAAIYLDRVYTAQNHFLSIPIVTDTPAPTGTRTPTPTLPTHTFTPVPPTATATPTITPTP